MSNHPQRVVVHICSVEFLIPSSTMRELKQKLQEYNSSTDVMQLSSSGSSSMYLTKEKRCMEEILLATTQKTNQLFKGFSK